MDLLSYNVLRAIDLLLILYGEKLQIVLQTIENQKSNGKLQYQAKVIYPK